MPSQAHASGDKPQWVEETNRNMFQELAALSHGVLTVGNGFTATGFAANIEACRILRSGNVKKGTLSGNDLVRACGLFAVDGFFDLFDGAAATATRTRSPLGRRLDAGTDPIRIVNSLHALWKSGILPPGIALTLAGEKAATMLPSAVANLRKNEPVVGNWGKGLTAAQRFTAGLYLVSATFEQLSLEEVTDPAKRAKYGRYAENAHLLALGNFAASLVATFPATVPYVKAAAGTPQHHSLGETK